MEIADEDPDETSESGSSSSSSSSSSASVAESNSDASSAHSDSDGDAESEADSEAFSDAGSDVDAKPTADGVAANDAAAGGEPDESRKDGADNALDELAQGVASCNINNDWASCQTPRAAERPPRPSSSGSVGGGLDLAASDEFLRPIEFLANEWRLCRLSLLEYMIRLASIESSEQLSHLEVPDEKLRLYLLDDPSDPGAAQHGIPGGQTLRGPAPQA
ncbi:hypothetical protein IWQ57_005955, partial [Coemansia nantahalensis]